ncbi:DUF3139 domain-containing protein [Halalkalibacter oceani]|uniref:DUF3139 domain-containing protein n=1 Tax=Halalkalibacter oceani TaxID=1653776 RepID=A0A9X2IRH8_9BACI|nr:DUF3139 domain-containing protein [Halalkalibacter oceani]MCM3716467.1 DUF3139 domain-containing protein [Halalkalibacter oceani]
MFSFKQIVKIAVVVGFIGLVAAPFAMIYLLNNGNPYHNYLINKHIPAHLEQVGYTEDDIVKQHRIEPKHGINRTVYHAHYRVIFQDEPQLEYLYGLTKKGKNVVQFCEKNTLIDGVAHYGEPTTEKTAHSEEECIGYLDNRG